jgi:hypothetical protein
MIVVPLAKEGSMSSRVKAIPVAVLAIAISASPVVWVAAQEASQSELAVAAQVAKNAPQLGEFNNILPRLATATKDRLIRQRPELYLQIAAAVDAMALQEAVRRPELDAAFAAVWAKYFTEEELVAINAFFGSAAGARYKELAGAVGRDIIQVSGEWSNRVGEELLQKSIAQLKQQGFDF